MRLCLVGADFEENLGVGMVAAAAERAGYAVDIVPFNERADLPRLVRAIAGLSPDVVGLSIQFQHRSHEFVTLAKWLRGAGFRGHITCGGQFPTLAWTEVLQPANGVDSVVLHEGEATIVDLLDALDDGRRLHDIPGIALLSDDGAAMRTAARPLAQALDGLPFPKRYRPHARHMGVPFIPIMAGRGCWGSCSYCSITSFYRDARDHGGGRTFRLRSPRNVATEMARLSRAAGGAAIFCFHDDNFLLPRPADSLARVRAIRAAYQEMGGNELGIIGKCRPETLTAELAQQLRDLGVIRLYVGVENASESGAAHLRRGKQHEHIGAALDACGEAGIFSCYNLLIFEPDAKLDDIRTNIAFMRQHATHPVNFCRAEPYSGTPLMTELADRDRLGGSYLGWDYCIEDDDVELLFRVCAAIFRERNFGCHGVANRGMGLGYSTTVLQQFYRDRDDRVATLSRRAEEITRAISLDTADYLERALALVEAETDHERVVRQTALLGLEVAAADRVWHSELDALYAKMAAFADEAPPAWWSRVPAKRIARVAHSAALGASLALYGAALEGCECSDSHEPGRDAGFVADPLPPDGAIADPVPMDAGVDSGFVADPLPPDGSVADPLPPDGSVADPLPPDASIADPAPSDAGVDAAMIWEAVPSDFGKEDAADGERELMAARLHHASRLRRSPAWPRRASLAPAKLLIDQWRDTSPRRAVRSEHLPLFDPPQTWLESKRDGERIVVELHGGPDSVTTRWECDGEIDGEGREVTWTPRQSSDRIRVAIRSGGGVAVVSLRASDVPDADRG